MSGGRLYFDITDIVDHAKAHPRVSGIQRVVMNVVHDAARKYGVERVRCIFYHRHHKHIVECLPEIFSVENEFDSEALLFRLNLLRGWKVFPSKRQVKSYLQRQRGEARWVFRALRTIDVYASAVLWKSRLVGMGLQRMTDRFSSIRQIALHSVRNLGAEDSLLMLSAVWTTDRISELATKHYRSGGDVVQMIHDLIPNRNPEFFFADHARNFNDWLSKIVCCTSRYVCNSESTASDLRRYLAERRLSKDIAVVRLAHEFSGFERNQRVPIVSGRCIELTRVNYVLCVGTVEIRKNGAMLLLAWENLHRTLGEKLPLLVFAGRRGWRTEEFDEALSAHPDLRRIVKFVESPTDSELASLYSNCLFTVFPSFYEGWGLPVGESLWFGKYCIASNASSIPEVGGSLVDYFNPQDLGEIVERLRRAILDRSYLAHCEERIAAAPLRRWRDVADDIGTFLVNRKETKSCS